MSSSTPAAVAGGGSSAMYRVLGMLPPAVFIAPANGFLPPASAFAPCSAGRADRSVPGVSPTVSELDLRKAYLRLALEYHPDKTGGER